MSIADKLTYLDGTKSAIKTAVESKGRNLTGKTFRQYAAEIDAIQVAPPTSGDYEIRWIDFDGTLLKSEWVNSGQDATPPTTPTHQYLTFHSWNRAHTNVTEDRDIGAIYNTTDGKSYLFVTLTAITGLSPTLYLNKSTADQMTVSWGDGSADDTSNTNGNLTFNHTYAAAGSYIITIECAGGYTFGQGAAATSCFGSTVLKSILHKIYIGNNVGSIAANGFYHHENIKYAMLPEGVVLSNTSIFYYSYGMHSIVLPKSVTTLGALAFFESLSIKFIVLSDQIAFSSIGSSLRGLSLDRVTLHGNLTGITTSLFHGNKAMLKANIPSLVTAINNSAFRDCSLIETINIPAGLTALEPTVFAGCVSIRSEMDIPAAINSVGATTFSGCRNILSYVFRATTPPTLANINAFTGINPLCKIYVPDASVNDYKAATNWVTYADYIYPLSTRP
jgi:hypothetical protein